jgi:transposase
MPHKNGHAYSQCLRDLVLATPGSTQEVARKLQVSRSFVHRVRHRFERLGVNTPGSPGNPRVLPRLAGLEGALTDWLHAHPDTTLKQLCAWVESTHGVRVGQTTMWKTLGRLGLHTARKHQRGLPSCAALPHPPQAVPLLQRHAAEFTEITILLE